MVTVACEHSPIFPAHKDSEGLLTLDFSVMQSVLEWYNSLTTDRNNLAYFLPDQGLFVFPENGEWQSYSTQPDSTFLCPYWLEAVAACPHCLQYTPCDCEFVLLSEHDLEQIEHAVLLDTVVSTDIVRNLIYTIRETQSQLEVEQNGTSNNQEVDT